MKVLLFGASGQLGTELTLALQEDPDVELRGLDRAEVDFSEPAATAEAVRASNADVVINAAAYTAVDRAESEPERARAINGVAPGVIAEACKQIDARLMHYSTDYVFDGAKRSPYVETDPVAPLNVYGQTKLEGDQAIAASGARHLILRIGWVYSPFGRNFFLNMLRRAREGTALRIVDDQVGVPTSADSIARVTVQALRDPGLEGVFHYAPSGQCSWFEFTRRILELADVGASATPIPSVDYPTPARRPAYSVMSSAKLHSAIRLPRESWQDQLQRNVSRVHAPAQA